MSPKTALMKLKQVVVRVTMILKFYFWTLLTPNRELEPSLNLQDIEEIESVSSGLSMHLLIYSII